MTWDGVPFNANSFRAQMRGFGETLTGRAEDATRQFMFDTCRAIAVKGEPWGVGTPIDTGFAANSWRVGLGQPMIGPVDLATDGIPGEPNFVDLLRAPLGVEVYFTTACRYMRRLEYGWSQRQAPAGMIRIVLGMGQAIMDSVAARFRAAFS